MTNESDLLHRARQYDEQALTEIYDRFSPALYRYAVRLLGDPDQAEDCVAETFARFLSALQADHGPKEHLQAYLYRVAHNWITDTYRRQPPPALPLNVDIIGDPGENPAQQVAENLEREQVLDALKLLTPDQRQVILLRFLEDQSIEQVAAALDRPPGAVKALQHRAVAALRRMLVAGAPVPDEVDFE